MTSFCNKNKPRLKGLDEVGLYSDLFLKEFITATVIGVSCSFYVLTCFFNEINNSSNPSIAVVKPSLKPIWMVASS